MDLIWIKREAKYFWEGGLDRWNRVDRTGEFSVLAHAAIARSRRGRRAQSILHRHSGAREARARNLEIPGLVLRTVRFNRSQKFFRLCPWLIGSLRTPMSDAAYRFFHPPRCPGAPPLERGAGPNSGPDWRESVGWKILLPLPDAGR